jgi:hypothetical protein
MALAATEAAVQVGAFAGAGFEGALDETQGLIETDDQLWRDHISAQRIGSALNTFGQAQDEVTLVYLSGDIEDVADEGHSTALPCRHGATSCRLAIVHDSSG